MGLRKDLRDAAKTALRAGVPAVPDARIVGARMYAWNLTDLPAIEVSTPESENGIKTYAGLLQDRVELLISIFVAGEDAEDDADAIADLAESTLRGNATFNALLSEFVTAGTRFIEGSGGDSRPARLDLMLVCVGKPRAQTV